MAYGHYLEALDHRVRRTVHTDHLLIFCHAGRGFYRTENHQGSISAGQVLFLKQGVAHSYHSDREQPWSIYWAHFSGKNASRFMDYIGISTTAERPTVLTLQRWQNTVTRRQYVVESAASTSNLRASQCLLRLCCVS